MKTLLVLFMLTVSALADPVGQGPCPQVTSEVIPRYIVSAIQDRLNDPDSMEVVDWTQPELKTTRAAGEWLGWWSMTVTIRARNASGGVITKSYAVMIEKERVTRAVPIR